MYKKDGDEDNDNNGYISDVCYEIFLMTLMSYLVLY